MNDHALAVVSETLRWHISARRKPVAYSIIIMVRCIRFPAESISRATSCWSGWSAAAADAWEKECHRVNTAGAAS